jgi:hypothetical protein
MKAYKVFNPDFTCSEFQYEVGKTYELKNSRGELIDPEMCEKGFHACKNISDCFNYYDFDPKNRIAEVELSGIIIGEGDNKQCSNIIKIVKELNWGEMLDLANTGKGNTGYGNSGDGNSGYRNSGNGNSGYGNSCNFESGDFNSVSSPFIRVFNKKCKRCVWENAAKPDFIYNLILNKWIYFKDMTDEEKIFFPKAFVCDGYLKTYSYKEAWMNAYNNASKEDIELLKALPNFSSDVFFEITGIDVK